MSWIGEIPHLQQRSQRNTTHTSTPVLDTHDFHCAKQIGFSGSPSLGGKKPSLREDHTTSLLLPVTPQLNLPSVIGRSSKGRNKEASDPQRMSSRKLGCNLPCKWPEFVFRPHNLGLKCSPGSEGASHTCQGSHKAWKQPLPSCCLQTRRPRKKPSQSPVR